MFYAFVFGILHFSIHEGEEDVNHHVYPVQFQFGLFYIK